MTNLRQDRCRMMFRRCPRAAGGRAGFTLVELLAVMGIIAILAGAILASANLALAKTRTARVKADLEELRSQLDAYRLKYNQYPPADDDAVEIVTALNRPQWAAFREQIEPLNLSLFDRWNRSYRYRRLGKFEFDVWSLGPDPEPTQVYDDIR